MAGDHQVEIRAPGLPPKVRSVVVPHDDVLRLELSLALPYAGPAGQSTSVEETRTRIKEGRLRKLAAGSLVALGAGLTSHGAYSWVQAKGYHDTYMTLNTMSEAEAYYDEHVAPRRVVVIVDLSAAAALVFSGAALWKKPPKDWFARQRSE